MKMVEGNIFDCKEDIIVHQTNCQGVMEHGIALQIKQKFPEVFEVYRKYCFENDPQSILGTTLIVKTAVKHIANIFGQLNYGEGLQTDYECLKKGFKEVREYARKRKLSIALPYKIGCGLAHGDWNIVEKIIEEVFSDCECTLYRYEITSSNYEGEKK